MYSNQLIDLFNFYLHILYDIRVFGNSQIDVAIILSY